MAYDPYTGEYTSPSTSSSSSDGKMGLSFVMAEQYSAELKECKQLLAEIKDSLKRDLTTITTEWDSTGKDRAQFLENMEIQIENIRYLNEAIIILYEAVDNYVMRTKENISQKFTNEIN